MIILYNLYSLFLQTVRSNNLVTFIHVLQKGLTHKSWYDATKTTGNSTYHTFYYSNIT